MRNHRSPLLFLEKEITMSDDNDRDIGEALKRAFPGADYPKDLKTATRAEFTTMVNMNQPKGDGCKKALTTFVVGFLMIGTGILGLLHILPS